MTPQNNSTQTTKASRPMRAWCDGLVMATAAAPGTVGIIITKICWSHALSAVTSPLLSDGCEACCVTAVVGPP